MWNASEMQTKTAGLQEREEKLNNTIFSLLSEKNLEWYYGFSSIYQGK